jgi:RimJ/RimL family protein N-acetyltransferase
MMNQLSVRAIEEQDVELLVDYWMRASPEYLEGMGAIPSKIPSRENFTAILMQQIATPLEKKSSYATIWLLNGEAIGHCNVNNIKFGDHAYMHLHLWYPEKRKKGMGSELIKLSVAHFFNHLKLNTILSEPYALNLAPHKTLKKAGFTFIKKYTTIPGYINFEQEVNRWKIEKEDVL